MPEDLKQSQLFESVSALVDNQATALELQRILAHAEKSTGVRARWHRYQLARAAMRGEVKVVCYADLSDSVRAAIAGLDLDVAVRDDSNSHVGSESVGNKPTTLTGVTRPWYASYGRVAIAATVALSVVFGSQQFSFTKTGVDSAELAARDDGYPESGYQTNGYQGNGYQRTELGDNANLPSQLNAHNVSSASFTPASNSRLRTLNEFQVQHQQQQLQQHQRQQQWEEEQVRQAIQRLMLEHAYQATRDQSAGLMPFIRVSDSAIASEVSR